MRFAPHQLFFPLGVLSSLIAVLVWILTPLRLFEAPALFIHSKLIFGGFLWSFITGFLMTAVPKMTGTRAASPLEVGISLVLVLLLIVQSLSLQSSPFYFTHAALMVWLSAFAARRFFARVKPVPVFFSHVGLAFLSGLLGCYYMIKGPYLVGVHLYHVGALLLLVLGQPEQL